MMLLTNNGRAPYQDIFFFSEKTHSLCLFQISQRTRPNRSWRPYFGGLGRSGTPLYPLTRSVERRGFAFVRFGSLKEAQNAVELAHGRSWRGRKIQVQMARFKQDVKASCAVLTKHPAGSPPSMPVRPAWKALPKISSNDFSRSYRGRGYLDPSHKGCGPKLSISDVGEMDGSLGKPSL